MITAASITDDQIRGLREELVAEIARLASTPEAWPMPLDKALHETDWALSQDWWNLTAGASSDGLRDRRHAARARCAEILNTRSVLPHSLGVRAVNAHTQKGTLANDSHE